jgi:NAD(P)H-nitrite reductase large subunit
MQEYKYVIIGGGIAGTTAAETIRKRDSVGKIAIVSDEPHPLYSRVLLSKPKWVLGEQPFENVWIKKEAWYKENNIHLFKGIAATALEPTKQEVTLSDGDTLVYEKLLLATGAHSRKWNVPGADKKGVHYLRTVDDAKAISEAIQGEPCHVVMIGSSCVSFEIIEILISRGFTVSEVMREKHFFEPQLSQAEAALIEAELEKNNVDVIRENEIVEILGKDKVENVRLKDGKEIPCGMVLPFIGVELPLEWIRKAGVATNKGIYANEFLETNVPNVYTAGDTSENWDVMLGETAIMGNWMSARLQGDVAGQNMTAESCEERVPFEQISFHTSHGFGHQIGWTGDTRPLPGRLIFHYPSDKPNSYARVLVQDGRIMGGTTINRPDLMGKITKMIKEKEDFSNRLEELGTQEELDSTKSVEHANASSCG